MPNRRFVEAALILFGCLLLAGTVLLLSGCTKLHQIDEAIWGPTDAPSPSTGPADSPAPEPTPPVLEIVAAVLAFLGYGGMAAWVKRSNSRGTQTTNGLQAQLTDLQERLAAVEATSNPKE